MFKRKTKKALKTGSALKITREDLKLDVERPPQPKAKIYDAVRASYGDKKGIEALSQAGYERDPILSGHNQSVFYNPDSKQLLFDIAGTHNASDILTDVRLGVGGYFGGLKTTARRKEAKDVYEKAKKKYAAEGENITIVGHSLGGSVASSIAEHEKGVHVVTYNKGVGLRGLLGLDKNHAGEKAYRTAGDLVSLLGSGKHGVTLLPGGRKANPLEAHSSENLKDQNIFL